MKIYLTGFSGGIGSAIKEILKEHEFVNYPVEETDWLIFAHGFIGEESLIQTFDVNTLKCISETQAALPVLKQGVIYISSTAGINGNSKFPIYSASKAALNVYAKSMAKAHPELKFFSLCPGPTDTKMWRSLGLEGKAQPPTAVADVVLGLMAGSWSSGSVIIVRDGLCYHESNKVMNSSL